MGRAILRMLKAVVFCGKRLGSALLSRQAILALLAVCIILELVVLGIGTTRRLELAYDRSLEVSRAQLAVIEAQELAKALPTQGSVTISVPTSPQQNITPSDNPPDLRPRDVDTILAQEADYNISESDPGRVVLESEGTAETDNENAESAPTGEDQLSDTDREELDRLIRDGIKALTAGDMKRCILHLEEASLISPDHPAMLYYYGMAYDKLLNPNKAREYYTRVFRLRDRAGKYFARASRRLTYGFEQPNAMRGKLSFGPHQVNHTYDPESGEKVEILLPVLLAPGEEIRPDDIIIAIQFFDLVNGRKIVFSRLGSVERQWNNETPDWSNWEESLHIRYTVPPLTQEELDAYGDLKYYGFTAKLYYKGEPLDCISTPSALILHEQRLNSRQINTQTFDSGLLPDDGLDSTLEQAFPVSDFLDAPFPDEP